MTAPSLAERIADSLFRNELEQEESLEPSETAAIIQAELRESPELAAVRAARDYVAEASAMFADREWNLRAAAILSKLDDLLAAITGEAKP